MRVKTKPTDSGKEGGDLLCAGERVWDYHGKEFGLTLGWQPREYNSEAGYTQRIAVLWNDGGVTWPCVAGILFKNGKWKIS